MECQSGKIIHDRTKNTYYFLSLPPIEIIRKSNTCTFNKIISPRQIRIWWQRKHELNIKRRVAGSFTPSSNDLRIAWQSSKRIVAPFGKRSRVLNRSELSYIREAIHIYTRVRIVYILASLLRLLLIGINRYQIYRGTHNSARPRWHVNVSWPQHAA